jgi:phosphomevalonate kinase
MEAGELAWRAGGAEFGLFEAVWNASRPASASVPLAISLDTTAFRDPASGRKTGLGSSAALTAALATALQSLGGGPAEDVAHAAHRRFQGGSGSGVDIACSIAGGVIAYRMANLQSARLTWPDGLYFSVLWSGVTAGTQARLAHFREQPGSPARSGLGKAAASLAAEFGSGEAARILAGLRDYTQALLRFDDAHGLGIFEAGHVSLAQRAAGAGVVYKPCGAGGGDIGVALATSMASLASFRNMAAQAGFTPLALSIDGCGAMRHDKDDT